MEQKKKTLLLAFSDLLYSMSASLSAGRQLPRAVLDARNSINLLWGKDSILGSFLDSACNRMENSNTSPEILFEEFAKTSELGEIILFASSLKYCRQKGGKLEAVCLKNSTLLIEKIELDKEIDSILSEKKLDVLIMTAMPFLILYLVSTGSSGYLDVLYESYLGKGIMTVSILLIVAAILWSLRIIQCEN